MTAEHLPPPLLSSSPLSSFHTPSQTSAVLITAALLILSILVYQLVSHPLYPIPGPFFLKLTKIPLLYRSYAGTEATYITSLFLGYNTPILRVGPDEVVIADGAALAPIYSSGGGFPKAPCYRNFDIDGFPSLFSALDSAHRAPRAKSVLPLFSTANLRKGNPKLVSVASALVNRLERAKQVARKSGGTVDVLDAARSAAVDTVTSYLFGLNYGGVDEHTNHQEAAKDKLSASEFVNAFVAVGRFFFLPSWAFLALEKIASYCFERKEAKESFQRVQDFVQKLVDEVDVEDATYQARMLRIGLSKEEVAAQMKDLMFAGTDSSGMNLSTFCWQLARHPDIYAKAKAEVQKAKKKDNDYDLSLLPYFRACLRETLRLSMANPTRLPRIVPPEGWLFTPSTDFSMHDKISTGATRPHKSYFLPAGTLVSVQIHTMHHNPGVFQSPDEFRPERWLETPSDKMEEMNRDLIPFSLGSRQCIARNMAMMELNIACAAILESNVLDGATNVGDKIDILEWFNSKVKGERVEIEYKDMRQLET